MPPSDEIDRLRAERDEWRRRAEVAEAVAGERLARAEIAERALRATEAALTPTSTPPARRPAPARVLDDRTGADDTEVEPPRAATLRERWRRYTETIN